ncbi:MAG: AIR synthase family protein [Eubacterium sp.]|nr:AIR synthase family protein [Eubacterium sp.]
MLPVGKLDSEMLKRIVIDKIKYQNEDVRVRAGVGEDCAVVSYGDYDCVISTDPITSSISDVGRLSIHISCNDIASNGVMPIAITLAVMLPKGTTAEDIETIMTQAAESAEEIGVEIVGGHTEITEAVNRPVIVSTAFGKCISNESQSASRMVEGDVILLTKTAGLEGTGIICSDFSDELTEILSEEELKYGHSMLDQVSVVKEGVIAGKIGTHGMHDVTEGGILGAVWEMCRISGLGAEIVEENIAVSDITIKLCEHFNIDWKRLISSGCMIIVASPVNAKAITSALSAEGIKVSEIGRVKDSQSGLFLKKPDGTKHKITPPEADELYKVLRK